MEERNFGGVNPMMLPGMPPSRFGNVPGDDLVIAPGTSPFYASVQLLLGEILRVFNISANNDSVRQLIAGGSGIFIFPTGIASFLPALILAQGLCLISPASIKGFDLTKGETAFRENVANARKRIAEARMAAEKATEEARAKNAEDPSGENAPGASDVCPRCKFKLADDDVFCHNCGQRRA